MRDLPQELKYGLVNLIAIFSRLNHGFGFKKEFSSILTQQEEVQRLLFFGFFRPQRSWIHSCGILLIFKPQRSYDWTPGFSCIFRVHETHF